MKFTEGSDLYHRRFFFYYVILCKGDNEAIKLLEAEPEWIVKLSEKIVFYFFFVLRKFFDNGENSFDRKEIEKLGADLQ